ncbi:MAG: adenylosuccinate synthetase [Dysosmobacter sp.]
MVDYLSPRTMTWWSAYQGGGNAGTPSSTSMGKFALHLLPSGIFREGVMNILGNGVSAGLRESAVRR